MSKVIIKAINIEVVKKKIKNIHLSVYFPDGRVRLAVPEQMDEEAIRAFAITKLPWIRRQKLKFHLQKREPEKEFLSGEYHYFYGNRYLLNVMETSGKQYVKVINNKDINLYIRPNSTKEKRKKVMVEWYREELKSIIPKYIEKWEPLMGVKVDDWGVKLMKTKWGSCNIQARRIWINLELTKKNLRCLEYIIVHEMIHLLERKHNNRFKAYMSKFLPAWRSIEAELNGLVYENNN